jgi:hypothetical protein
MQARFGLLRDITLPFPPTPGQPYIFIGPDVPTELATFNVNLTVNAVILFYYNTTDYFFQAIGTFYGDKIYFEGTFDDVNGVYIVRRIFQPDTGIIKERVGSYLLDPFQMQYTFQQTKVAIGDGSNIDDEFIVNCRSVQGDIYYNINGDGSAPESWHAVSFQNGWSNNGAGQVGAFYRAVASPNNCTQLIGAIKPGTKTNGTTIFTLPAAYRPSSAIDIPVNVDVTAAVGGQSPHFNVTTAGLVQCYGVTAAGFVSFNGLIPRDV